MGDYRLTRAILNSRTNVSELITLDQRRWQFLDFLCQEDYWIGSLSDLVNYVANEFAPVTLGLNPDESPLDEILHSFVGYFANNRIFPIIELANDDDIEHWDPPEDWSIDQYELEVKRCIYRRETMSLPKVCAPFRFIAHARTFKGS